MSDTLVIQSHNFRVMRGWIGDCVRTVHDWAGLRGYDYHFLGDEIFDLLPTAYREKTTGRFPIQADLARLFLLKDALESGYRQALWFDADLLIYAPERLEIDTITDSCAFGREIWVDTDKSGKLKTWRNMHNAVCLFRKGDPVLPFLIHTTQRIIAKADAAKIAPQMVGPKLLTALDSIAGFGRLNSVAAFSPAVIKDIDQGGGPALERFFQGLKKDGLQEPAAANLCASLEDQQSDPDLMSRVVERLQSEGGLP